MSYNRYGFKQKSAFKRDGTSLYSPVSVDYGTLDSYNDGAVSDAIATINQLNPNHKYLMFAMLSDIHKGHNFSYAGIDARAEQTFQMIAKVNASCSFDAIVCGGDLLNGYDEVQYYEENLDWTASKFNQYFQNTAVCTTVGNHDKKYNADVPLRTNDFLSGKYKSFISASADATVRELEGYPTNYALDFNKYKVRLILFSGYDFADSLPTDRQTEHNSTGRWKRYMNMPNADEWMIGTLSHTPFADDSAVSHFLDGTSSSDFKNTNGCKGKGYIGTFRGHTHSYKKDSDIQITVGCSYEVASYIGKRVSGEFVVFIVDTDQDKVHAVRVGRGAENGIDTMSIQYSS